MFEKKKIFEYFVSWGCFGKEVLVWFLGGAEELQQLLSSEKKKHPDLLFVMYNPISGIHLGSVCFCRPLICCNFTFQYVETLVVRLRNKQHLVRVRRRSCLGLKYLLWLSQTQLEMSSSLFKNVETQCWTPVTSLAALSLNYTPFNSIHESRVIYTCS